MCILLLDWWSTALRELASVSKLFSSAHVLSCYSSTSLMVRSISQVFFKQVSAGRRSRAWRWQSVQPHIIWRTLEGLQELLGESPADDMSETVPADQVSAALCGNRKQHTGNSKQRQRSWCPEQNSMHLRQNLCENRHKPGCVGKSN